MMKSYGLKFVKMDLQVHTPASTCFADKTVTPSQIVEIAEQKGLKAIAITDHNTGQWVDQIKDAARSKKITIFPGVELTVGDAHIHLIALLDIERGTAEIEALLSRLGVLPSNFGQRDTFIDKSVNEVIQIVTNEYKGLCFPAHIDSTSGVFKEMRGQPRIEIIQNPNLLAVEAVNIEEVSKFLNGTDPEYKRRLAVIQSSDNPTIDKDGQKIISGQNAGKHSLEGIGYRFTHFKVDEKPTLESLRQCFVDPEVRIRSMSAFREAKYPYINSMKIAGGFLDGVTFEFHPGLNSVLGGKGVGKSLIVEFARFALNQESTQLEILTDHESKLDNRLEQYGIVELDYCDETGKSIKIKRTYNKSEEHPFEGEAEGAYVAQLYPVLFVSQNEIIKIAENPEQQLQFIDRFFDFHTFVEKIATLREELLRLDQQFADRLRSVHKRSELGKKRKTIEEEIEKLNRQLANPEFTNFSGYEEKNRFLVRQYQFLKGIIDLVPKQLTFEKTVAPVIIPSLKDDQHAKRINDIINDAILTARKDLQSLISNLKISLEQIVVEYDKFRPIFEEEKKKYEEIVRNSGGDAKSLEATRKRQLGLMDDVLKQIGVIENLASDLSEINDQRDKKLQEYFGLHDEYYRIRKEKSEKIEKDCDDKIKIEIKAATNREEFRKKLQQMKVGSYLTGEEIDLPPVYVPMLS
ncbi:MAG: AAA family ATPase [Bacteroidota bacterium]